MEITAGLLYAKIGQLEVENDLLKVELRKLQEENQKLKKPEQGQQGGNGLHSLEQEEKLP